MKNKYLVKNINNFLNSNLFKVLLLFILIMSLFIVQNHKNVDIISSISLVFSDYIFIPMCILPMILFVNNYIYTDFITNTFMIFRYKSKRKYFLELIKNIFASISIMFLIIFSIVLIMENIFNHSGYQIILKDTEYCYNITYMIFVIFKLYIFIILYSFINTILIYKFENKIIIIINFILFAFIFYSNYTMNIVNSLQELPLFIGNYLLNNIIFLSFYQELVANIIMYILLFIILLLLIFYLKYNRKDIG